MGTGQYIQITGSLDTIGAEWLVGLIAQQVRFYIMGWGLQLPLGSAILGRWCTVGGGVCLPGRRQGALHGARAAR